ncbi:MAG: hypothetical protein V3T08_09015 [Gemmatimonadota bacterium]
MSIAVFAVTRRYSFLRASQLTLILLVPFLLMVTLGGFVNSSAVILWSLLAPLGAIPAWLPPHIRCGSDGSGSRSKYSTS